MQAGFDVLLRVSNDHAFDEKLPEGAELQCVSTDFSYYWIDRVFFDAQMTENEIKRSLIDHDGYDSRIVVRKQRKESGR